MNFYHIFSILIPTIHRFNKFDIQFINLIKDNYINFYSDRIPTISNKFIFFFIYFIVN